MMARCRVRGCTGDATDFVTIHVPNTATDNYDAVNPVKVPICVGHMAVVMFNDGPSPGYPKPEAFDL